LSLRTSPSTSSQFPSAAWTAQQIIEAFPENTAPKYIIRDRDGIYGEQFRGRVERIGIEEVLTAPRSPWQNPYAERMTHLSVGKDAPEPRAIQPPSIGIIVALPEVGGLHHRYERRAA
jgi:hypothetical protein